MKKSLIGYSTFILFLVFGSIRTYSQQGFGTNTPNQASVIEMESASKGVLIPRVELINLTDFEPIKGLSTNAQFTANSLLVYNTATAGTAPSNVTPGFYYWLQPNAETPGKWVRIADTQSTSHNVDADNGLTKIDDSIQLGGELIEPTAIVADDTNTLAIDGLQTGTAADNMVVADPATGVLKQVKQSPRFFYMPAVIFDTSTPGTYTRDLYQEYKKQFEGTNVYITGENNNNPVGANPIQYTGGLIGSAGAPAQITVYTSDELYYYITYYDQEVFSGLSIDEDGLLTYNIVSNATDVSYMNIVFVVKE